MELGNIILSVLPELGVGIIFVWLFVDERKRSREMAEKWISALANNIKTNAAVEKAIENNTKAVQALVDM